MTGRDIGVSDDELEFLETNRRLDRDIEIGRWRILQRADYDEYIRSGGADRLLELMREEENE